MEITVNYLDNTKNIFDNITEIFKLDQGNGAKTELNHKEDLIRNNNIYQLIGKDINCTLDLISKHASSVIIEF